MNGYLCKELKEAFTEGELLGIGYACMVIAILGCPLNMFTIYCYQKTQDVRQGAPTNQLLFSMNVYDTVNCVVIIPFSSVLHLSLSDHCVATITYISLNAFSVGYCSFLITLIALQRYLKVTTVIFSSGSPVVSRKRLNIINTTGLTIITLGTLVIVPLSAVFCRIAHTVVFATTSVSLPVIYILLYRAMKTTQQHSTTQSKRSTMINNRVTINVLILIMCHYLCCTYIFVTTVFAMLGQLPKDKVILRSRIGLVLFSFNSCINPFIYVFRESSYRRVLKSIHRRLKLKLQKETK